MTYDRQDHDGPAGIDRSEHFSEQEDAAGGGAAEEAAGTSSGTEDHPTAEPDPALSPAAYARVVRGDDARQGEIILKTRQQRIMFIGGLVALVVVVVVAFWLAR